jgi:4-hydroxy-tetrahydrodipicolinate synthase
MPATFSRAPMPEASQSQQAVIRKALDGLGALGGSREAAE